MKETVRCFVVKINCMFFYEQTACLLRVPVEVVKQRAQAAAGLSSFTVFRKTVASEVNMFLALTH